MPHRPEDTSTDEHLRERPGEQRDQAVEGSHWRGPRPTGDTQPPAPANRRPPGESADHGVRRRGSEQLYEP